MAVSMKGSHFSKAAAMRRRAVLCGGIVLCVLYSSADGFVTTSSSALSKDPCPLAPWQHQSPPQQRQAVSIDTTQSSGRLPTCLDMIKNPLSSFSGYGPTRREKHGRDGRRKKGIHNHSHNMVVKTNDETNNEGTNASTQPPPNKVQTSPTWQSLQQQQRNLLSHKEQQISYRTALLNHEMLTKEQELAMGEKIQRANKLRDKITDIVMIKQEQEELQNRFGDCNELSLRHMSESEFLYDEPIDETILHASGRDTDSTVEESPSKMSLVGMGYLTEDDYEQDYYKDNDDDDDSDDLTNAMDKEEHDLQLRAKLHRQNRQQLKGKKPLPPVKYGNTNNVLLPSVIQEDKRRDKSAPGAALGNTRTRKSKGRRSRNDNSPPTFQWDMDEIIEDRRLLTDDDIHNILQVSSRKELRKIFRHATLAREELVRCNIKLVVSIAKKWAKQQKVLPTTEGGAATLASIYDGSSSRPSLDDAIQEGIVGLTVAADRFDPKRGLRFSTYSTYWITNNVRRCYQLALTGPLRIPQPFHDIKRQCLQLRKSYHEAGRPVPDDEALADELGVTVKRMKAAMRVTQPLLSLDSTEIRSVQKGSAAGVSNTGEQAVVLGEYLKR